VVPDVGGEISSLARSFGLKVDKGYLQHAEQRRKSFSGHDG
jgi:hypothetical protein